jgi:protein O-mannosyl-transferase
MKKILLLFTWILLLTLNSNGQTPKPRILGVVMGISKYQNVPSLRYADRDAMSFYNFLLSPSGGAADTNNIRLLLNEKATSYNFFEAMDNLLDMAKEGDQVYIYFAGHGDVEKKTGRQNGFLIGYNAPANCYAAGGCVGVRYLQDYVETLVTNNKTKVTMIIDACRSGKLAGGAEGAEVTALALKAEWKGVTKILSCQPGETSLEGEKWGGGAGVFTYFMLKGMLGQADKDGDGKVSVMELNSYLDDNVLRETNNKQIPEIVGDKRQEITRINKEHALALLNQMEKPISLPPEKQSAGFEIDKSSIDDISVLKDYEKFKYYINNNNLIAYNVSDSSKETALSIYRSLEKDRNAQPIITKMKRELLAALQNKTQTLLNSWIESSIIENEEYKDNARQDINIAFSLADSSDSQYKQIKYKYLIWKYFYERDTVKEINLLEECININPEEPLTYNDLASHYYDLNNYEKALVCVNKALELSNNWSISWSNKGNILDKLGKSEEAIKYYDKAIEIKYDNHLAWSSKGFVLQNLGKSEEAIKCYDKAIELKYDSDVAWNGKGYVLQRLNQFEEALKCYAKAMELNPDDDLSNYNTAIILFKMGKIDEALKYNDKTINLNPDDAKAWTNKGIILNQKGSVDEALKCFEKAIEIEPGLFVAWLNKGAVLYGMNKYDEANVCFDKAIGIKPKNDTILYYKGNICKSLGKWDDAIKYYDNAIEIHPGQYESWAHKGLCLDSKEKFEEAIKCYDKAIEIDPGRVEGWTNKGYTLNHIGKPEEALNCFNKAIDINPKYSLAWTNKCIAYMNLGKYEESMKCVEKEFEINPNDYNAWFDKGNVFYYWGKPEEALKCFDKAIEINPNIENVWNNKGAIHYNQKKWDEALNCMNKVIEINPQNYQALIQKGVILHLYQKNYVDAINYYKKALEFNPNEVLANYNLACAYSMLKNKTEMLKFLKKTIELDSRKYKVDAPKDEDFKEFWNDPDFLELVK